jgi:acetylglutamate kinase
MERRGVVGGIDHMAFGEVNRIDVSWIWERLEANIIVIVSNLGYSGTRKVLNCKYVILYHWRNNRMIATTC